MIGRSKNSKLLEDYLEAVGAEMKNSGEPAHRIDDVLVNLRTQVEETMLARDIDYAQALSELDEPQSFGGGSIKVEMRERDYLFGPSALAAGIGGVVAGQGLSAFGARQALTEVGDIITLVGVMCAIGLGAFSLDTRSGRAALLFGVLLLVFIAVFSFAENPT